VVNNLAECQTADGAKDFCLTGLITSSKTSIKFGV
jgi:hypothetical protein